MNGELETGIVQFKGLTRSFFNSNSTFSMESIVVVTDDSFTMGFVMAFGKNLGDFTRIGDSALIIAAVAAAFVDSLRRLSVGLPGGRETADVVPLLVAKVLLARGKYRGESTESLLIIVERG